MHDVTTATTHGPLQPAFDCETEGASLDWNPRRLDPRAAEAGSSRSTPMEDIWISPTWWP